MSKSLECPASTVYVVLGAFSELVNLVALRDAVGDNDTRETTGLELVTVQAYETSATVEGEGQVRISGVPFAPGTEVEVTIHPKSGSDRLPEPATSLAGLYAALDKSRNVSPVGPLRRDELYDRDDLH
jgi:hypothetical protein